MQSSGAWCREKVESRLFCCLKFKSENLRDPSWPGLARPSTSLLRNGLKEVVPVRIIRGNQSNFPRARPMLDVVFALDGIADGFEFLEVDEPLQSISPRKALYEPGSVFEH